MNIKREHCQLIIVNFILQFYECTIFAQCLLNKIVVKLLIKTRRIFFQNEKIQNYIS